MSPCKARAPGSNPASSFADSLFSVKTIVRPPLN
uniref:Dead box ATP-dependent RNA helicase n=1 Tax=Rhizophora mucronata TaxID=61149 RepID=A0A2P2MMJ1_RHIMU